MWLWGIVCLGDSVPRLAFNEARVLTFVGIDSKKFLNGLSSNKIDFTDNKVIDSLVLNNRAKILAQLHLFELNNMIVGVTIANDFAGLKDYLNSKVLSQDVTINDVSQLNHIDLLYDEDCLSQNVIKDGETTIININNTYHIELYSINFNRKLCDGNIKTFTDWRINNLVPWYNHEITSSVNPYQCGLGYQVHENKGCYTGQEILTRMRTRGRGIYRLISQDNSKATSAKPSTAGNNKSLFLTKTLVS